MHSRDRRCGFAKLHRKAFSLIELLAVIGIVSLLLGLVLASVQSVRASAARVRCQNNLRQLALALQSYHAAQHRLPIGVTGPATTSSPYPYMNWHTRLLPHLEQSALWEQAVQAYQQDHRFTESPPHIAREAAITLFLCPADGRMGGVAVFGSDRFGMTSYLGVAGTNNARANGTLYLDSATRLGDITDGTSNTLLVGERPPSADYRFGWWYAGWGQNKDGECDGVLGVRTFCRSQTVSCPEGPYTFTPGKFNNQCDMFHFWSPHSGGANFAFADGSVRFLSYSADPIMPALATRAGGEAVSVPE